MARNYLNDELNRILTDHSVTPTPAERRLRVATPKYQTLEQQATPGEARASKRAKVLGLLSTVRVKDRQIAIFTRQLAVMLNAGIQLTVALGKLTDRPEAPALGTIVRALKMEIDMGTSVSAAFSRFPTVFNDLYVSMTRVGEVEGQFGNAMASIAEFMDKDENIRHRARAALTYPFVITTVALSIVWALFNFMIPKFVDMFEEMHIKVPAMTRLVIGTVRFAQHPATIVACLLMVGLLVWGIRYLRQTEEGRFYVDNIKLGMPLFGNIIRKVATARAARALATLLEAGVPTTYSMLLAGNATGNEVFRRDLRNSVEGLKKGARVADHFDPLNNSLYEPLVWHMIRVGEETGSLDKMMIRMATYFETEVEYALNSLEALIEPLLTVSVGVLVAVVCVAIFLPLYGLIPGLSQ